MDNTVAAAQVYLKNPDKEPEIAEHIQLLLKEMQALEKDNAALDKERQVKRNEWRKRAYGNSERLGEINIELQSLLPNNPIPSQGITP